MSWWENYSLYLRSEEWKSLRAAKIAASGGRCELTGIAPTKCILQCHHLVYRPDVKTGKEDDLIVLAAEVHDLIEQWKRCGKLITLGDVESRREALVATWKKWQESGYPGKDRYSKRVRYMLGVRIEKIDKVKIKKRHRKIIAEIRREHPFFAT